MKKSLLVILAFLLLFLSKVSALEAPIDITKSSIEDLQNALDKGYITSELLVKLYLNRIDAYDEQFNSINQINPNALNDAKRLDQERKSGIVRGPLHGIPILVKTNIDVVGLSTTAGAKSLSDNYPVDNSDVVQKLVDAGAIILGSTNMSEFAFSADKSYSSFGYVYNAFNTDYTSYGSSGGGAVSIAASFAAASLGTDTNSSVRIPASAAGLVGIRPTTGILSKKGVIPYDVERDTVGILSKNVYDNVLIYDVITGTQSIQLSEVYDWSNVTIGVPIQLLKGEEKTYISQNGITDEDIYNLSVDSINKLESAGAKIVYVDKFLTSYYLSINSSTYAGITMCDGFNEYIKGTMGNIKSFQQVASMNGHVQNLSGYVAGCNGNYLSKSYRDSKKAIYRDYVDKIFLDYDLDFILYPTIKNKPFLYNQSGLVSPGSVIGSVIGYPSITVPMGKDGLGFHYGIEFLAKETEENKLYNVSYHFEQLMDLELVSTSLAPSLYEVPLSVSNLISVYEKALNDNIDFGDLKDKIKYYFDNYNDIEEKELLASDLIDEIEKLYEVKDNKLKNRFMINVVYISLLLVLIICEVVKIKISGV